MHIVSILDADFFHCIIYVHIAPTFLFHPDRHVAGFQKFVLGKGAEGLDWRSSPTSSCNATADHVL